MLESLQETLKAEDSLIEPERVRALRQAGFTSHPEILRYEQQVEAIKKSEKARTNQIEAFKLLLKARKTYGEDTLLLPFDQFTELCNRHKLVCGGCEEFIGDIPEDKLQEITELLQKPRVSEIVPLRCIYECTYHEWSDSSDHKVKRRYMEHIDEDFPFIRSLDYSEIVFADGFRANADRSTMELKLGEPKTFFMCAPKHMFSERRKIKFTVAPNPDPIVCALTKLGGVLLFTRWGEEANDKIIKRYEELGKRISELEKKLFP